MDDPIFDPWCLGDEAWPTPSQRTSRWRGAGKNLAGPAGRPAPGAPPPPDEEDPFVSGLLGPGEETTPDGAEAPVEALDTPTPTESDPRGRGVTGDTNDEPPEAGHPSPPRRDEARDSLTLLQLSDMLGERDRPIQPAPKRGPGPRPDGRRRAVSTDSSDAASQLRSLLVPRIVSLSGRLSAARHGTTVDDRLAQHPPSLRFRIEPWHGPFDPEGVRRGAVLEVVLEGGLGGSVAAHFWLDPLSATPTERRGVPAHEVTGAWLDTVLLDFVRKALR